jgi:hypothetical protein
MNTQYKQKSNKVTLVGFLAGVGSVLAIIAALLVLEKLNVTHFYTKPVKLVVSDSTPTPVIPSAKPTNTVNYGAPTPGEEQVVPSKNPTPSSVSPINSELSATFTNPRINSDKTLFLVKVAVTGATSGTCSATMTNNGSTATKTGTIALSAGQYSCSGLDIPMDTLTPRGTWSLSVTVTDQNNASTTVKQEVDIQ